MSVGTKVKHYIVTIFWLTLFLFDITIGLDSSFEIILPLLLIVTGALVCFYKILRPKHIFELILWVPVLGWLIFIVLGYSMDLWSQLMPQMPFFVYEHYFSWAGLVSILGISLVFSVFGYSLFQGKVIVINLLAGALAALLSLLIYDTKHIIFFIESAALVISLCLATYGVHLLAKIISSKSQ